jgi:predicted metal-binding membrane protein
MNPSWLSMPAMDAIPMAGGWSLSALWLPMCGQTSFGAAAAFTGMWGGMMVPMMLPALGPCLWRYLRAMRTALPQALPGALPGAARAWWLAALAGMAWSGVWILLGVAVFCIGTPLAQALVLHPAMAGLVPHASGLVGVAAAGWHLAAWPLRWRRLHDVPIGEPRAGAALRHGLRLGVHCIRGCTGLTVALIAAGMADWRVMACGACVVAVEQLLPFHFRSTESA